MKKNFIALSIAKEKCVMVDACCGYVIWMNYTLEDYKICMKNIFIKCDNTNVICLIKNHIQHS